MSVATNASRLPPDSSGSSSSSIAITTTSPAYVLLDDSGFGADSAGGTGTDAASATFTTVTSMLDRLERETLFPFVIILLVAHCIVLHAASLLHMLLQRRHAHSPSQQVLVHYMCFRVLFCVVEFFNILSSTALEGSFFYMTPTPLTCALGRVLAYFLEASINFQLLLIWLVLLAERRLVGFRCLYADFELRRRRRQHRLESLSTMTATTTTTTTAAAALATDDAADADYFARLREPSVRNVLTRNSRHVVLAAFYAIVLAVGLLPFGALTTYRAHCSISSYASSLVAVILVGSLFLFFLPIFYWLLVLATVMAPVFGGARDPLRARLTQVDVVHLKFVKVASLLKFAENFFLHVISTHDMHMSRRVYELSRIVGLAIALVTVALYMRLEGVIGELRRTYSAAATAAATGGRGGGNDDEDGGRGAGRSRVSYFVFRNQRADATADEEGSGGGGVLSSAGGSVNGAANDDDSIVYRNLVETA